MYLAIVAILATFVVAPLFVLYGLAVHGSAKRTAYLKQVQVNSAFSHAICLNAWDAIAARSDPKIRDYVITTNSVGTGKVEPRGYKNSRVGLITLPNHWMHNSNLYLTLKAATYTAMCAQFEMKRGGGFFSRVLYHPNTESSVVLWWAIVTVLAMIGWGGGGWHSLAALTFLKGVDMITTLRVSSQPLASVVAMFQADVDVVYAHKSEIEKYVTYSQMVSLLNALLLVGFAVGLELII